MKRLTATICLVLVQSAVGLTPMGPPKATDATVVSFNNLRSFQEVQVEGFGIRQELDTNADVALLGLDFGIGEDWQMVLFVGLGNMDTEGTDARGAAGGISIKNTCGQRDDVAWGLVWQGFYSNFAEDIALAPGLEATVDFSYFEVQFATGVTYEGNGWQIYGGPFLHFLNGEIDFAINDVWLNQSLDMEKKLKIGAYGGLTKTITENISINVEGQFIEDAQAVTLRCSYRF